MIRTAEIESDQSASTTQDLHSNLHLAQVLNSGICPFKKLAHSFKWCARNTLQVIASHVHAAILPIFRMMVHAALHSGITKDPIDGKESQTQQYQIVSWQVPRAETTPNTGF